jgi:hypothetical protein
MSAKSVMRSVMRTRVLMPRAAKVANQACSPVFSMQLRQMSIPRPAWDKDMKDLDPEVYKIIQMEQDRQHKGIALIPSENYTTHAVSQVDARMPAFHDMQHTCNLSGFRRISCPFHLNVVFLAFRRRSDL